MPFRTARAAVAIIAAVAVLTLGAASGPAADAPSLGTGRFVIYVGQLGGGRGCTVDRQLASRLRAAVRGVRIGRVLAAPGCSARRTARLVFGRATVSRSLARRAGLERALRARPRRTTVIVGPAAMLARARGLALPRGDAWVFDRGQSMLRLRAPGWSAFLATRRPDRFREWSVTESAQVHPHDIWPAGDGTVWYTAQFRGAAGRLDAATGAHHEISLGSGSSPHGVVADAAGNAWITDQGLDAIVRVDRATEAVTVYPIPVPDSNPNTAVFDQRGVLWFTGAGGYYGRVDPASGRVDVWPAARGGGVATSSGPYGITVTPDGVVWFVSLTGGYLGRVDRRPAA